MDNSSTERKVHKLIIFLAVVSILLIAGIIVLIVNRTSRRQGPSAEQTAADIASGREYLQTMESMDPVEIENRMFRVQQKKLLEERKEQILADPDAAWQLFADVNAVIMGDSRAVGFSVFGYMDESRVLADGGNTIREIREYYDYLAAMNPRLVVLAYGINDINSYWYWTSYDEYVAELNETVAYLNELLPEAYIYVQSIIPATEPALTDSPSWYQIYDWNEWIHQDCLEHGWRYLDLSDVINAHAEYYEVDGIHMMTGFYPYWAQAIALQYLEDN